MSGSDWTPSIVPNDHDQIVYFVAEDFGRLGRAWREADYDATNLETVISDVLSGQYNNPIRVIAFDTAERWSEDVSEDVADELRRRCDLQMCDLPASISDFVERHEVPDRRQLTLRFANRLAFLGHLPIFPACVSLRSTSAFLLLESRRLPAQSNTMAATV